MNLCSHQTRSPGWARLIGLVLLLAIVGGPPTIRAAPASMLLVSDPQNPSHRTIVEQILHRFDARQGGDGSALIESLDVRQLAEHSLDDTQAGLVVTVGARAAADLNGRLNGAPVLNVFLPLTTHRHLQAGAEHESAAIVLDQPLRRQLAVARALLPQARTAGMLRSRDTDPVQPPSTDDYAGLGFELQTTLVERNAAPADAIQQVLHNTDLVVVTFDPNVYTPATAKWLLYLAFQQDRPIIGFSYALLKAGAVAAVFSTPEQIGEHTVEVIADWLATKEPPQGTAYPRYYQIGLNAPVARRLGVAALSEAELERGVRKLLEGAP
jgi:ABC-type uncharacterized transport system substrate-binding protein